MSGPGPGHPRDDLPPRRIRPLSWISRSTATSYSRRPVGGCVVTGIHALLPCHFLRDARPRRPGSLDTLRSSRREQPDDRETSPGWGAPVKKKKKKKKKTTTTRTKKTQKADPIRLIRACFRDIRRVTAIPGQTIYFVTDDGRVVSTVRKDPRILAPKIGKAGYVAVRAGRRVSSVARLVLEAFGPGRRSRKFRADHLNGNPGDNRIENLRWLTDSDWKRDIEHPERRSRAATLERRTAVIASGATTRMQVV